MKRTGGYSIDLLCTVVNAVGNVLSFCAITMNWAELNWKRRSNTKSDRQRASRRVRWRSSSKHAPNHSQRWMMGLNGTDELLQILAVLQLIPLGSNQVVNLGNFRRTGGHRQRDRKDSQDQTVVKTHRPNPSTASPAMDLGSHGGVNGFLPVMSNKNQLGPQALLTHLLGCGSGSASVCLPHSLLVCLSRQQNKVSFFFSPTSLSGMRTWTWCPARWMDGWTDG